MPLDTQKAVCDHIEDSLQFLIYSVPHAIIPGGFHIKNDPACDTAYYDSRGGQIVFSTALAGMISKLPISDDGKSNMCQVVLIHEAKHAALTRYWPKMTQGPIAMVVNHLEDWRINRTSLGAIGGIFADAATSLDDALGVWRDEKSGGAKELKKQEGKGSMSEGKRYTDFISSMWTAALNPDRFEADIYYSFEQLEDGPAKEALAKTIPLMLSSYSSVPENGLDTHGIVKSSLEAVRTYHEIIELTDDILFHNRFEELIEAMKKGGYTSSDEIADRLEKYITGDKSKQTPQKQEKTGQQPNGSKAVEGQESQDKGQPSENGEPAESDQGTLGESAKKQPNSGGNQDRSEKTDEGGSDETSGDPTDGSKGGDGQEAQDKGQPGGNGKSENGKNGEKSNGGQPGNTSGADGDGSPSGDGEKGEGGESADGEDAQGH